MAKAVRRCRRGDRVSAHLRSATNIGADRDSEKHRQHAQETAGVLGKLFQREPRGLRSFKASGTTLRDTSKTAFPIARTCFVSFIALVGPSTTSGHTIESGA